jgi:hypothetical protein
VLAASLVLFLAALGAAVGVARVRAENLKEETLTANMFAAQDKAKSVLLQLRQLSDRLLTVAEDQRLIELMKRWKLGQQGKDQVLADLKGFIDAAHQQHDQSDQGAQPEEGPPFQSWHILDAKGILVADSVDKPKVVGVDFAARDYFQGAIARAKGKWSAAVHVSRIYQSRNDNLHKVALAVAIRNPDGAANSVLGVVAATVTTKATFGSINLSDKRRKAVLIGRRDLSLTQTGPGNTEADQFLVLIHEAYAHGHEAIVIPDDKRFRQLLHPRLDKEFWLTDPKREHDRTVVTDANYRDPMGEGDQPWLAGFAPVGATELVVVVQQRYDETIGPEQNLVMLMTFGAAGALVIALLLIALSLRWRLKRG